MLNSDGVSKHINSQHSRVYSDQEAIELPLRLELFSAEQRRDRGRMLGQEHAVGEKKKPDEKLLARLADNAKVLGSIHRSMVDDVTAKKSITPVGEWLVDNYYVIEEQISLATRHLPPDYLAGLPTLENPGMEGIPRVYDLAEHIIAHGDGRVDSEDVCVILAAYQEESPLKLGELWAIPIMLRLALIENIRRLAVIAQKSRRDRELARKWADAMTTVDAETPKNLIITIADMARSVPHLSISFVAELKRRLQGRSSGMKLPLQWIEQNLQERNMTVEQAVNEENHNQALMEISMRNCVNSLRSLNVTDWSEFVETMSLVEQTLRQDPADVYTHMDFPTRDSYRRVVESLAKKSPLSEVEVAARCLALSREAHAKSGGPLNSGHVGYYLIGPGDRELKAAVSFRGGIGDYLRSASTRVNLSIYLGAILLLTIAFTVLTAWLASLRGIQGLTLALLTALLACAAAHVSVGLVNFAATLLVKPRALPRMNYAKGIPPEKRTLVVIPMMLSNRKAVDGALRGIEIHYLNNRGPSIHFGLLTDFTDASSETQPADAGLLAHCRKGIERLNQKYPAKHGDNFYLFHRPRVWNAMEQVWMGHERKRGKLEALNRFLRWSDADAFSDIVGDTDILHQIRYVITLDSDTIMARDSAWQMVGTMAHPLMHPVYSETIGRVVQGHGILQPRVDSNLAGAIRSPYARMCATEMGIDPYTRASSDVYQDLFDEGSFIGKGIYDVEIFDKALGGRFPDNKILSHDLLEGCVVRSGLLSDVKLYEDPPSSYLMDIARRHRWVRGDWQIANYLLAKETRRGFKSTNNPLSLLSQWKIFDNLRRSLVSIGLLLLLILGLTVFTTPGLYVAVVGLVFIIPVLASSIFGLVRKSPDHTLRQHLTNLCGSTLREGIQALFRFSCLPFEAYVNADAIVRSQWRQHVSRRLLLQWNPSDNSKNEDYFRLEPVTSRMWVGPVTALAVALVLLVRNPDILPYALPLLVMWFVSPLVVALISKPKTFHIEPLPAARSLFLRKAARRTWRFFEDFVTAEENWLPPDNFQEYPLPKVAHRTSPTNIGMSLLSNLSAVDFGYQTPGKMLRRCEKTVDTMLRLDRFRGHFYNWYDTRSLQVLRPAYVSSVDSGNLSAHLRVLAAGMRAMPDQPIVDTRLLLGLRDTLDIVQEESGDSGPSLTALGPLVKQLGQLLDSPPKTLSDFHTAVADLAATYQGAREEFDQALGGGDRAVTARQWLDAWYRQLTDIENELRLFAPWLDLPSSVNRAVSNMTAIPSLKDVAKLLQIFSSGGGSTAENSAVDALLQETIITAVNNAEKRMGDIRRLVNQCEELSSIEFNFLYDRGKRLLSIGYNVEERRLDNSFYDLLASEARLSAYLGVAYHRLPQASWFALGRMLTRAASHPLLVSWSGSMFEYLMPLLVMPSYPDSLLDETYKAVVAVQMEYGKQKGVPWGISESGFNVFDSEHNYQYRAFGVPDLGLKHGLSEDLVIAPYATALALMIDPDAACKNLQRLAQDGCLTSYGFYEAVDYTPSRLPRGADRAVVRSFMAHHQGMSLVAMGQALFDRPMHGRFQADPVLESASLLLQEMVPAERALYYHSTYSPEIRMTDLPGQLPLRVVEDPGTPHPEVQLLSNGRYHVMLTAAGGGYSRFHGFAVTRWRQDVTMDNWGAFCYLRDRESGKVRSTTFQPLGEHPGAYTAVFAEGKAEFIRQDKEMETRMEVVVSTEDDVEIRRVKIHNRSAKTKLLDLTTFSEVALANPAADDSHQAFSKLFIETSLVEDRQAIICTRRPRSPEERDPLMFHMLVVHGETPSGISYETDRAAFLGRGRTAANPAAVFSKTYALGNSHGIVLDPAVAIRAPLRIESGESVTVDLVTGVADERKRLLELVEKYHDPRMTDKAFDLAWSHGQLLLRQLNASETEAQLFCRLAGSIIYPNPEIRADPSIIFRNHKGQSGLWSYAISGDLPIVLVMVEDPAHMELVKQLLQAHTYWRLKGLKVDLVIWNENQTSYRQNLHDQLLGLAGSALEDSEMEKPGGIFIRSTDRIAEDDKALIQTVASVVLRDDEGVLEEQLRRFVRLDTPAASTRRDLGGELPGASRLVAEAARYNGRNRTPDSAVQRELMLENGWGGFTADGKEYVITVDEGATTPLPWVNVIANPFFGTVVSESGSSYTWFENAHEFRLTPWSNDPITDPTGEALYLRDEQTGEFWSPTPSPCGTGRYTARHGFGYSVFEHKENDIRTEMTVFVDMDEPVKYIELKVRNRSDKPRGLAAVLYAQWVLGDLPSKTGKFVVTGVDSHTGALLAKNDYNDEYRGYIAFLDTDDPARTVLGDRTEFIGRNRSLADPDAMQRPNLSGSIGAGLDPCGAVQVRFGLAPGQERKVIFRMGMGQDLEEVRRLVKKTRGAAAAREALEHVQEFWSSTLGVIQVETPDAATNVLANGWLLYQTLSCRFWGRTATYQSGGAYGFRDQLQDSMALLYSHPELVRDHLLESACHQFAEGDVLHWWHPPLGRGVRTRCSDDYSVLDEDCRFLTGRPLGDDEESYYDLFAAADESGSLYEHCRRALLHGLRFGRHGLPLMGSGDWNDGMDRVGLGGQGESVWLAFFLHRVLADFEAVARNRGDETLAGVCRDEARKLARNIEDNAWDDDWYRRAYFDDGTPLGSAHSEECRIDSIAQSWSVLSGVGSPERVASAMRALYRNLVDADHGVIKLFEPPFDKGSHNPGYIKGYVPGVRENGGQYTHGAIWAGMAFAEMRDRRKAWELYRILNPVNHGLSRTGEQVYKVEPYVVSADVYAAKGHIGRGGWSWYTGSASWLYRLIIESLLGLRIENNQVRIVPCVPIDWDEYKITLQQGNSSYHITVRQSRDDSATETINVDGTEIDRKNFILTDDGKDHQILVTI